MSEPMGGWFRFYHNSVNDPKVQRLSGELYKFWSNCLCLTSMHAGKLPSLSNLSFELRVPEDRALAHIEALSAEGLLDKDGDWYAPHNWGRRQYLSDNSTERVKRFRERKRNVPETGPEAETDSKSETDIERASATQNVVPIKGKYVFEGRIIKLTHEQFDRWKKAYPLIPDFIACLHTADSYYAENVPEDGKWFFRVSRWLEKSNTEAGQKKRVYGVDYW